MKRLAEYCGLCWHETDFEHPTPKYVFCMHCDILIFSSVTGDMLEIVSNPDFTGKDAGNSWGTLSAAITAKGEWEEFYEWLRIKEGHAESFLMTLGCIFHEKPAADKSRIFNEYLRGDV